MRCSGGYLSSRFSKNQFFSSNGWPWNFSYFYNNFFREKEVTIFFSSRGKKVLKLWLTKLKCSPPLWRGFHARPFKWSITQSLSPIQFWGAEAPLLYERLWKQNFGFFNQTFPTVCFEKNHSWLRIPNHCTVGFFLRNNWTNLRKIIKFR